MDGAGNALRDFENDSVRQEIGQFTAGRWQKCSSHLNLSKSDRFITILFGDTESVYNFTE